MGKVSLTLLGVYCKSAFQFDIWKNFDLFLILQGVWHNNLGIL